MRKNQRYRKNFRRETAIINLNKALEIRQKEGNTKKIKILEQAIENTIENMK